MRFHALMLVRDEADILAESLAALLEWVDAVYLYDLGSTDGRWDLINDFAARDKRVIPFLHQPTVYTDGLRCVLFDRYRERFQAGDWIMKVDADEFYRLPAPAFVRERLDSCESMVYLQWYFFRLTTAETAAYESGEVSIPDDRRRFIRDRRRFYKISRYSEPRMFRYRPTMQWPATSYWPYNAGFVARERIPILHYPHRDPWQMQTRFKLRAAMMARKAGAGSHWKQSDWREDLVDESSGLTASVANGRPAGIGADPQTDSGPLLYWKEGETLSEIRLHHHLPSLPKRCLQRVIHAALLPFLDERRPPYNRNYRPETFSDDENRLIGRSSALTVATGISMPQPRG